MARLSLDDVAKRYGKAAVLDGVSLEVESGEIVVVCGPSGAGKTVLLRLIAGTDSPDRGDIRIDGKLGARPGCRAARRRHGVPELRALPAPDRLREHREPAAGARAGARARSSQRVEKIAALLRIDHVLGHAPRELSNGQKQRTSLARALVRGPGVLLLDDPLRNVDAKLRYEMRLELPRLLRELRLGRDLRHPGLSRGDGAGPPHRRPAPGPLRADRPRPPPSMPTPPTSRSRACSAIPPSTSIRCRPQDGGRAAVRRPGPGRRHGRRSPAARS